jgi:hypothetical protein
MSDERGGVRFQDVRASLQEILRVALAQVFQPRDSRLGGMQPISQLLLGEPAELSPCSDEMRAAPFGISYTRHAARLLLTKLCVVAVKCNFCLTCVRRYVTLNATTVVIMQRELSRRSLLAGTAAAATASAGTGVLRAESRGAIGIASDAELFDLAQTFARALDAYQAARDHYNHCEDRYFARRPCVPEALTESGPLGHLLPSWLHWSAAELRQILKNPEHSDV